MALWFKKKNKAGTGSDQEKMSDDKKGAEPVSEQMEHAASEDAPPENSQIEEKSDQAPHTEEAALSDDASDEASDSLETPDKPSDHKQGLFSKLKRGLAKTREILTTDIEEVFAGKKQIDDDMLEEIEELLITSDIGIQTTMDLMKTISRKAGKIGDPNGLKETIKQAILSLMEDTTQPQPTQETAKPHVIMVIGVNGVGKTTTIGKLASRKNKEGHKVLIAAADTFRAAAVEQLAIWAERSGSEFVRHKENADPAAVAYDGMQAALARNIDTVFIDTAGRLHTKVNLMEELKKIQRTITKTMPDAPHEIILVLDATTGQNALSQAKLFHESIGITGLVLTKLDGTAKGGIVISICQQLKLPLLYIGVGEGIDDLQPFDPDQFVNALF